MYDMHVIHFFKKSHSCYPTRRSSYSANPGRAAERHMLCNPHQQRLTRMQQSHPEKGTSSSSPEQTRMSRGYPMPITYLGLSSGRPLPGAVHCATTLQGTHVAHHAPLAGSPLIVCGVNRACNSPPTGGPGGL